MPKIYLILLLAIIAETVATTALQSSRQFTRLVPSVIGRQCLDSPPGFEKPQRPAGGN